MPEDMLSDFRESHHVVVEVHVADLAQDGRVQSQGEVLCRGLLLEMLREEIPRLVVFRANMLNELEEEEKKANP